MNRRRAWAAVLGAGLAASQAGHLLTYQLLFGGQARQIQSSGAHAYFPALAKTGLGVGAAIVLGGLLMVGLARILSGRRVEGAPAPPYLRLLAFLFTIQLATFGGQETVEAAVGGSSGASVDVLLLAGTLGQLPVAAVAALALRWLLVRVGPALAQVRSSLTLAQKGPSVLPALVAAPVAAHEPVPFSRIAAGAIRKRGPPSS